MAKVDKIKDFLKEGVNEQEVESALENLINIDENFLEAEYGNNNKTIRSWADRKVTKAIEGFKTNTMSALVDQQVQDRIAKHKNETEAEKQLRLINERLDRAENERKREQHINSALKYAGDKGIPTKYVDRFLGADIDETKRMLDDFATDFNIQVNEEVDDRFKEHGRNIGNKGNNLPEKSSWTDEEIARMSPDEFKKNFNKIFKQK